MRRSDFDGAPGLPVVVNAAKRLEMRRVEALDAERQAIDAGGAKGGELFCFDRAGVGFERNLGVRQHGEARAEGGQQRIERLPGEQAGRTAAEEDAAHAAPPDERQC